MAKRRHKRLFPKSFSSTSVRTSRLDSFKAAAYNMQRSKVTTGSRGNTEHKLGNSFTQDIPETIQPRFRITEKSKTIETRNELLIVESSSLFTLYRVWQGQNHQGVDAFYCTVLEKHGQYSCTLFFSGNEYIIVLENGDIRMISSTYHSREEILQRKNQNKLSWVLTESISQSQE